MLGLRLSNSSVNAEIRKLRKRLNATEIDRISSSVATASLIRLKAATPERFTKKTRAAWVKIKKDKGRYWVQNKTPVMRHLEFGTRAHGPVTARFLFIPLNARTAKAGSKAVYFANRESRESGSVSAYKRGRDFVLARRVRGIRAMRLVPHETTLALQDMRSQMIRRILRKM